jgi:hypothetical protein
VKNVPYVLTFGQCPCIGISNLPVDPSILDTLHTNAELNMVANFNPVNNKNPVVVMEIPYSLDSDVLDQLETLATDFAVENVKDKHGKEVPEDSARMVMVRRNCICYEHN